VKITYIFHSGFAIETSRAIVLIDYYHDTDVVGGYVRDHLLYDKRKMYVLSTHFHPDHFTPEIMEWKSIKTDITYVLSKDIFKHRRLESDSAHWLVKGETYEDEEIRIKAYGSTDVGVSFLIEIDSHSIFHAGDLNNWSFGDDEQDVAERRTKRFLGELKDINKDFNSADISMFPVDARLGDTFTDGPSDFLKRVSSKVFIPMHFSECGKESAELFKNEAQSLGARFWLPQIKGDSLLLP